MACRRERIQQIFCWISLVILNLLFVSNSCFSNPSHPYILMSFYSHSATKRRSIRKVRPTHKLDLFEQYKHSEEAKLIEKQLDHSHIETRPSATKRCGDYINYHFKRIPYNVTSFFLQVCCWCQVVQVCVCKFFPLFF